MHHVPFDPQSSGIPSDGTVLDAKTARVRRLHVLFPETPQGALFKVGSCFVITAQFHASILRERLSGCIFAPMDYSFAAAPADVNHDGAYLELRVGSQVGKQDFALTEDGRLFVSEKVTDILIDEVETADQ